VRLRFLNYLLATLAAAALVTMAARGDDILVDFGPETGEYDRCYPLNNIVDDNRAESVEFVEFVMVTGLDLWTCVSSAKDEVHVRILIDDGNGEPGEDFLNRSLPPTGFEYDGKYNGTDLYKVSVDFDPVLLRWNTPYWIGLSGNGWELGQAIIRGPGDDHYAAFNGLEFDRIYPGGDLMFRLRCHVVFPTFEL
jgi:hypothetical protein